MWFTSNCEAVGEGLLYVANLGRLKKSHEWEGTCQLYMEPEFDILHIWLKTKDAEEKVRKSVKTKL